MTCHILVSDATGINSIPYGNDIKVWGSNRILHISGLQLGQKIKVYSVDGSVIYKANAEDNTVIIPVNHSGAFIVTVNGYSTKVLVK